MFSCGSCLRYGILLRKCSVQSSSALKIIQAKPTLVITVTHVTTVTNVMTVTHVTTVTNVINVTHVKILQRNLWYSVNCSWPLYTMAG